MKYFRMKGECLACGNFETMYVGDEFIDEKCCNCGLIIGGGYFTRDANFKFCINCDSEMMHSTEMNRYFCPACEEI